MQWYFLVWSILMLLCILTQLAVLSELRDSLKVLRMFAGGWTTSDEEMMKRGEG